ncbi:hypothetical protein AB0L70_06865 [Kribbella sp. NPDC051952]|uniref:hypothetical protein n=1 Tax=Kribbella sp. NPDC051952 TaxID=3154851 RepID=UPI0034131B8F
MRDVLISYVTIDRVWADWVASQIEDADHRVWLERADRIGWQGTGTESLAGNLYVPIVSAAYLLTGRETAGWWLTEVDDKLCADNGVLPLILGDDVLVTHTDPGVDVLQLDESDAIRCSTDVRAYLGLSRVVPQDKPGRGVFGRDMPGYPPDLSPTWQVGPRRAVLAQNYALASLEPLFSSAEPGTQWFTISGPSGTGKAREAIEYAYRHAAEYAGSWFLNASDISVLPAQGQVMLNAYESGEAAGPWLLILADLADPDISIDFPGGDWHVLATSHRYPEIGRYARVAPTGEERARAERPDPRPVVSDTSRAAALLELLCAFGPGPIPIGLLVTGADGAPSNLATTLQSRIELGAALGTLCVAGDARRTPDSVTIPQAVREQLVAKRREHAGHARNMVMLAVGAYVARDVPTLDWLPLLPHAVACLSALPTTSASQQSAPAPESLLDYANGWEIGDVQHQPLAHAIECTAEIAARLGLPDLAVEFAERLSALAYSRAQRSEAELVMVAVHRGARLRQAGRPQDALDELERAARLATRPIDRRRSDRDLPVAPVGLFLEMARVLADLGRYSEAVETMNRMWRHIRAGLPFSSQDHRFYLRIHAEILLEAGEPDEALEVVSHALVDEPDDDQEAGRCYSLLAIIFINLSDVHMEASPRRAVEAARDALANADRAIAILSESGEDHEIALAQGLRAAALDRLR